VLSLRTHSAEKLVRNQSALLQEGDMEETSEVTEKQVMKHLVPHSTPRMLLCNLCGVVIAETYSKAHIDWHVRVGVSSFTRVK
jgi:hypothetical protein